MGRKSKKKKAEEIEQEKIEKIMKRLESEEKAQERVKIDARLVSSPENQSGVSVKVKAQILDDSFYAQAVHLFFNAGTEQFEEVTMEKMNIDNFAIVLGNIPKEIQILYYIKVLDKSNEWIQFPRPELIDSDSATETEQYFSFIVEPNGNISFKKAWDDASLVNCPVCQYACQPTWDVCPECNTPLYDTTQEVLLDSQKEKEEARKKMKEDAELSWDDATDEFWRTLPECPNCGYTVQQEWSTCPVCNLDLTTVDLKEKASFEEFMTEEEKQAAEQMSEIKKRKNKIKDAKQKKKEEPEWDAEEGIDVL